MSRAWKLRAFSQQLNQEYLISLPFSLNPLGQIQAPSFHNFRLFAVLIPANWKLTANLPLCCLCAWISAPVRALFWRDNRVANISREVYGQKGQKAKQRFENLSEISVECWAPHMRGCLNISWWEKNMKKYFLPELIGGCWTGLCTELHEN